MKNVFKHSIGVIAILTKLVMFTYFVSFFIGADTFSSFLPVLDEGYEFCEEFEQNENEKEEAPDDENRDDQITNFQLFDLAGFGYATFELNTWKNQLVYKGFQREVPDPPPKHLSHFA